MGYYFERIPRLVWGCGDTKYGDKDAKQKALKLIEEVKSVFISDGIIWDYEKYHNCKILNSNRFEETLPSVWQSGFYAHAIPSEIAIKMLNDFKPGYFDGFMLRDINLCGTDNLRGNMHLQNVTDEHLLLDFDGLIYGHGCCTDHCYD